ncbi:SIS domain-containing protein [Dehalococcoidia bacterium]|nr:SIS domain-containing protein [Dehalococcoidia bacterium]
MTVNASEYARQLYESMAFSLVTDKHGNSMSLDEGGLEVVNKVLRVRRLNKKILLCGNGGSAAVVSHVQNDLAKAAKTKAMVFNETPLLTALANDISYDAVFEQPFEMWCDEGDLVIAVSSSGKSESILKPVRKANENKTEIITFSGFSENNPLRSMGDVNFYIDSDSYGLVETSHAALLHYVTDCASVVASQE